MKIIPPYGLRSEHRIKTVVECESNSFQKDMTISIMETKSKGNKISWLKEWHPVKLFPDDLAKTQTKQ